MGSGVSFVVFPAALREEEPSAGHGMELQLGKGKNYFALSLSLSLLSIYINV